MECMSHGTYDGGQRRRPSWYSDDPGPSGGSQAESPQSPSPYQQPPSAAQAGGYGMGYPRYGYSPAAGYPSAYGYSPTQGYSPTPGTDELNRMHDIEGQRAESASTAALVLSIIGFFTLPFVMGPLAIWQASKARRLGNPATAGWVLGWICTLWGVAILVMPFLFFLLVAVAATA